MSVLPLYEQTFYLDRLGRQLPVFVIGPGIACVAAGASAIVAAGTAATADTATAGANATAAGACRFPAVIVIHEIFGLNAHIKDIALRFAEAGLYAFAPDLFANAEGLPADRNDLNGMRAVWQSIPDSQLISDLQEVLQFAGSFAQVRADEVGTIGYCMGGAIALMFACSTPQIAWVADYYGRIFYPQLTDTKPKHPIAYTQTLASPFLGLFSGQDELITPEHVEALKERLTSNRCNFQIKVYPAAKHAFFNNERQSYNQDAAADAWKLTLELIRKTTGCHATIDQATGGHAIN